MASGVMMREPIVLTLWETGATARCSSSNSFVDAIDYRDVPANGP